MSEFFNPKEDILSIELTSYGIEKLKNGDLQPRYYSFHDDEVYYGDSSTDSVYRELQKDDHTRIYKETSYIRNYRKNSTTAQSYYKSESPLGTALKGTAKASCFDLRFYDPEVTIQSRNIEPLSTDPVKNQPDEYELQRTTVGNITTLDLGDIIYSIEARELRDYDLTTIEDNLGDVLGEYSTDIFPDQSFIKINAPDILFSISEDNVENDFENFDIEILIEEDTDSTKDFIEIVQEPKYEETTIEDDLLIEKDNTEEIEKFKIKYENTDTSSEFFLLEADEEIPEHIMSKYFKNSKKGSQDSMPQDPTSVYSDTLSGPFGEDC